MRRLPDRLAQLALASALAGAPAYAVEFPDQKLLVGMPSVSYTKKTYSEGTTGSLPMGFGAEYSLFLKENLGIFGQFEINLEPAEQSTVFIGGSAGLAWYVIGGVNPRYKDPYVTGFSRPGFNVFLAFGFGGRQFDFQVVEKDKKPQASEGEAGVAVQKDAKDVPTGSVVGRQIGFGAEYPIAFNLTPGLRFQQFQSFVSNSAPDISTTEIWLSVGFLL